LKKMTTTLARSFQSARTEFKEFSIPELKKFEDLFKKYNTSGTGFLDLAELKYLMEQLQAPQTHLALKAMIKEVDEDLDNQIAYREFLLIFRYAKTGRLSSEGLRSLAQSVNVGEVGVGGAKGFFEQKAAAQNADAQMQEKDRQYREQVKQQNEEKKASRAAFKEKAALFQ